MPLFTGTQQQYYTNTLTYNGNGSATAFDLNSDINLAGFDPLPAYVADFTVYFDGTEQSSTLYDATPYNSSTGILTFDSAPANGVVITITQTTANESLGNYQSITLKDIVNNFIISYVGEDKIIPKVRKTDVLFHAQRGIQELSYDTLRSSKSQEIEIPPDLTMALPHDYVNYVKLSWKDDNGVEKLLLPARKTSNPLAILQDSNYKYLFDNDGVLLEAQDSDTWNEYKGLDDNVGDTGDGKDYIDEPTSAGRRYGLEPENATANGLFYVYQKRGKIYFSSSMNGKTITLKYISDSLGTSGEIKVHKFAEEAIYKWIAYAIASTHTSVSPNYIPLLKRERFAAIRQAKLRLSNLKSEEIAQIMRGKSKFIKH